MLKTSKKQTNNDSENLEERNNMIVAHFFFSVVWSIGSTIKRQAIEKFDAFLRTFIDPETGKRPKDLTFQNSLLFPRPFTVYDYVWVRKQYGGMWLNWNYLIEHQALASTTPIKVGESFVFEWDLVSYPTFGIKPHELIINTTETVKINYFCEKIYMRDNHVMFIGPTGEFG